MLPLIDSHATLQASQSSVCQVAGARAARPAGASRAAQPQARLALPAAAGDRDLLLGQSSFVRSGAEAPLNLIPSAPDNAAPAAPPRPSGPERGSAPAARRCAAACRH